uniref:ATP-dependent RNA helicase n=1 Tax=Glycine max TaxID=3847 RepID=A0A0R0I8R5_SOYBN
MGAKKQSQGVKNKGNGANNDVFASCSFSSLGLDSNLCEQLRDRLGFEVPTLVQAQAIPVILSGRHALVNAATGTGKTVAYLAPIIHHLQGYENRIQRSDGTFGISILIATPGRLLDHLKNTTAFLYSNLRWIIFDEADRILELGFGKDIEEILDLLGSRKKGHGDQENTVLTHSKIQRQNLLLSATLNEKVNHLAKMSLDNPVMIGLDGKKMEPISTIKRLDSSESDEDSEDKYSSKVPTVGDYKVPIQLIQRYMKVPCGSRLPVLLSILKHLFEREPSQKVVLFFSTCDAVDFHYSLLSEFQFSSYPQTEGVRQVFLGCKTFRLHGNMQQEDRRTSFQAFKTEKSALLLSTDVSARGLDFPKVRCIIQYDSPGEATEYVHRVGRTARLGERGESLLFLQPVEIDYLQDLEKHGVSLTEYPVLKVLDSFPLQKNHTKKSVFLESHPWVLCLQKALEAFIMSKPEMDEHARKAFCSWVRAYTAHRGELKRIL